jgi:hypothetical protein
MKKQPLKILVLAFMSIFAVLTTGCTAIPVYNIDSAPIVAEKQVPMEQIKASIMRAGIGLGWVMRPTSEGRIVGTLTLRKHVAIVDITYSQENYSIQYKDSTNLKYDGTNIHKNYNGWVQNLNNAIQSKLSGVYIKPTGVWSPFGIVR